MFSVPMKKQFHPKGHKPNLAWHYLPIWAVEAHVFGTDAALAFAYIRYTRKKDRNYEPSTRLLVASVPGLSDHRARFVMECIARRIYFAENELPKANKRFGEIIKTMAAQGKNYKRLNRPGSFKGTPFEKANKYERIAHTIKWIMNYDSQQSTRFN